MTDDLKSIFTAKVVAATDAQLSDGYGSLKKLHRVAIEGLTDDRETVANLLQNQTYLDALDDVEQAKLKVSILQWKLGAVEKEIASRFRETVENDTEF